MTSTRFTKALVLVFLPIVSAYSKISAVSETNCLAAAVIVVKLLERMNSKAAEGERR